MRNGKAQPESTRDEAATPSPAALHAVCPLCGERFACGVLAGSGTCWCFSQPAVKEVPGAPAGRCVCPACLARAAEQRAEPS